MGKSARSRFASSAGVVTAIVASYPWASARPLGRCSAEVDAAVRGRPLGGTPVALHRQRRFDEEIPDPVEANAFGDLLEELLLRLGWKLDSRCKLVRELPGIRRRYLDVAPG